MTVTAATTKWAEGASASPTTRKSGEKTTGIHVTSNFDSGNIDVVAISDPAQHGFHSVDVRIHPDPYCESDKAEHFQWFYFRVSNCKDEELQVNITNAGKASYTDGWKGYNVCASFDKQHWFRVSTTYDAERGVLSWTHVPGKGAVYYAYFAPYTYERHQSLVAELQCHELVELEMVGETLDGHDLDVLRVGTPGPGKRTVWVVARQHPGESMAEWFAEGMLRRLLDRHDATSRKLLQETVFYVVPNINPDGTWRGHLRTNAAGANLNREWAHPCLDRSPEVYLVREKMEETGCDMLVDVHGDEALPYNFVVGNHGIPSWGPRLAGLHDSFSSAFQSASPDFQTRYGYGTDSPGRANMKLCSKHVGERFDCLAVTLEMPFKDTADSPDPLQGWSPERAARLGGSMLDAVLAVVPQLR
ncbi:hypothetical protein N2152v2_001171 [Parachlorella kessleri]